MRRKTREGQVAQEQLLQQQPRARSEEPGARSGRGINRDATRLCDEETTLHEGTDNLNQGGRLAVEPFRVREGLSHVVDWPAMISYGMIKTLSGHRGTRRIETIRQITATAAGPETRLAPLSCLRRLDSPVREGGGGARVASSASKHGRKREGSRPGRIGNEAQENRFRGSASLCFVSGVALAHSRWPPLGPLPSASSSLPLYSHVGRPSLESRRLASVTRRISLSCRPGSLTIPLSLSSNDGCPETQHVSTPTTVRSGTGQNLHRHISSYAA